MFGPQCLLSTPISCPHPQPVVLPSLLDVPAASRCSSSSITAHASGFSMGGRAELQVRSLHEDPL